MQRKSKYWDYKYKKSSEGSGLYFFTVTAIVINVMISNDKCVLRKWMVFMLKKGRIIGFRETGYSSL